MIRPQVELLSPAGSPETLKAVAAAGADAVYAAGNRFGARAYANNFTEDELIHAIDYLHLHGKRLYLTVNTLLKEAELKGELYTYLLPLYRQGLDGVIVQDLGVLAFLREYFPKMELHASTQMNITGPNGAALMKKRGCSRVVTARELSLSEIRAIHEQVDIEIESFIHGALCYCYSGQCLLSSMLGGRSGNRGRCAQPCRLPYRTKESGERYFLSPKDLCTIERLPQIIDSGVYSLKIEGRMKQAEYAAGVTGIYREYLDRILMHPGEEYRVSCKDKKRLLELGSRSGFTGGYYLVQNGPEMMAMEQPSHTKANELLQQEMRERYLHREIQEKMNGILILSKEKPASLVLKCKGEEVTVTGDTVQKAKSRPVDRDMVTERLCKTGGTSFEFGTLEIRMEDDVFIPVGALNQLRRDGIARLTDSLLRGFRRNADGIGKGLEESWASQEEGAVQRNEEKQPIRISGQKPAERNRQKPYLAVGVQTKEQCMKVAAYSYVERIYIDSDAFQREQETEQLRQMADVVHGMNKELYYVLPPVLREKTICWYEEHIIELAESGADGFVTGSYEGLQLLQPVRAMGRRVLADSSLYVWSSRSFQELLAAGADACTLPVEANRRELIHRGFEGGELLLYGYLPLMVSAQCLVKNSRGCSRKMGYTFLTDRYGKHFPVKNQCRDCYNILYNSSPLSLFHQQEAVTGLGEGYRISFTLESGEEMEEILAYYEQGFLQKERIDRNRYLHDYTNGHFQRGVE